MEVDKLFDNKTDVAICVVIAFLVVVSVCLNLVTMTTIYRLQAPSLDNPTLNIIFK